MNWVLAYFIPKQRSVYNGKEFKPRQRKGHFVLSVGRIIQRGLVNALYVIQSFCWTKIANY